MKKVVILTLLFVACAALTVALSGCKTSGGKGKADASAQSTIQSEANGASAEETPHTPIKEDTLGVLSFTEEEWLEYGIPASFDLRSVDIDGDGVGDRCFVTPVKSQNPFGTCWAFASISAAETSLLGSVYLDDPDAYKTLDLSEKQMAYFAYVPLNEEGNPHNGEGYQPDDKNAVFQKGGSAYLVIYLMAQGAGPVGENGEGREIFVYSGKDGEICYRIVDGVLTEVYYSESDDWTIPDEYRFYSDYTFEEGVNFGCPNEVDAEGVVTLKEDVIEDIKLQLLQRHGVAISFYADVSRPTEQTGDTGDYLYVPTWSHYTWENLLPNHAVTIVGWDDDYPKENFIEGHQPAGNGAWLVKNSWGSGEEDFPNARTKDWGIKVPKTDENGNVVLDENGEPIMVNSGYFWLSYYDMSISDCIAILLSEKQEDLRIDQYDYLPLSYTASDAVDYPVYGANVYKAESAQMLDAVVIPTDCLETEVTIRVYLLGDKFIDPKDGYLAAMQSTIVKYEGVHKIKLDDPVLIQKGQNYSIVVQMRDGDGKYLYYDSYDYSYGQYKVRGIIRKGESFLYERDGWKDFVVHAKYESENSPWRDQGYELVFDNLMIKGYNHVLDVGLRGNITRSADNIYLIESRNSINLTLYLDGKNDDALNTVDVKWFIADEDGEEYVSIVDMGDGVCQVVGKKEGRVHIAATVDGIGTTVAAVDIKKMLVTNMVYSDETYYDGQEKRPMVVVTGSDKTHLIPDKDYEIVYFNNEKCGIGRFEITLIGDLSEQPLDTIVQYFAIKPEKAVIESAYIENGKIIGSVKDRSESGVDGYWVAYMTKDGEWHSVDIYDVDFEIELEDGEEVDCVTAMAFVIVNDMAPEDVLDNYGFEDDTYYLFGDWSEYVYFEEDAA